jgi:hypothetical protein
MHALRIVLLGVAVVIALALGGSLWRDSGRAPSAGRVPESSTQSQRELAARRQIEAQFAEVPAFGTFFARLRDSFPLEYEASVQRAIDKMRISGHIDPPEQYLLDSLGILRRGRGLLAARARDEALTRLFEAQARMMGALAESDPKLCVGFLYGAAGPGFTSFAAGQRSLVADMANAGLDAVVDGQANRIARPAPSDGDFQKIEAELTDRGFGRSEIDALLDGRVPDPPLPDAQMCRAARAYLDVLKGLPPAARMGIYALSVELMSRS